MNELLLVRHGETDWNAQHRIQGSTDIPLNDEGRKQAGDAGRALSAYRWDALYSSTLSRARETARIIGAHIGIDSVATDERLIERHFGEAEGMLIEQRRRAFPTGTQIPGAESWEAIGRRGAEALTDIVRAQPHRRSIVIAHGGLIKSVLAEITDGEFDQQWTPFLNGGATYITWDGEWHVHWYNRKPADVDFVDEPVGNGAFLN